MTETAARARQQWTQQDLMVLGGLAVIAGISIALGFAGASRIQPVAGLALILALAYCLSSSRRAIDYRMVAWGLGLQFVFALIVLKTRARTEGVQGRWRRDHPAFWASRSKARSSCSGPLGEPTVWRRIVTTVLGPDGAPWANIFAFMVLPTIIFIAALFACSTTSA